VMRYLAGFELVTSPKYGGADLQRAVTDNLLGQRALWSAVQLLLIAARDCSVELRMIGSLHDRSIGIYLLLRGRGGEDDAQSVSLLRQLLPKEYVWQELTPNRLREVVEPPVPDRRGWRIARVIRRLQYLDLPSYLPPEDDDPTMQVGALRLGATAPSDRRYLPDDPTDFLAQAETTRFCLPLMSAVEEATFSDRRSLWEEMQTASPVVISVTLNPFPRVSLEGDRQVATRLRSFVDHVAGALANSGFAQFNALRGVFDRYFLSGGHLGLATIRVAATDDGDAMAVAQQFCVWIGAMRTFAVLRPTRPFDRLEPVITDPAVDVPANDTAAAEWERPLSRLRQQLDEEAIHLPEDPRYGRFLVRLPHVYSLDELGLILRLPVGFEAGLPGLSTRLLPPFHPSTQQFEPVLQDGVHRSPVPGRIRIGRVNPRTSVAAGASDEGLHWHSIPLQDLTKHALVVGSTGSGKTVTTMFLMRELIRLGVPFLVVEPVKTEYHAALRDLPGPDGAPIKVKRYRLEGSPAATRAPDYLPFDPLRLQPGVTVARHVSYLKSCFEAAFPMADWQALFIENALLAYYLAKPADGGCGLQLFTRGREGLLRVVNNGSKPASIFPSFDTFSRYFLGTFLERELSGGKGTPSDRIEEFRQVFRRRFENLSKGPLGEAFRQADWMAARNPEVLGDTFGLLLNQPTVVELDAVPDGDQKALAMAFLMTFLYERRQVDDFAVRERGDTPDPRLRHVLVVEEAHRLLANPSGGRRGESVGQDSKSKAVSLFVDMLAEIRAFGQGLVIVEQIPTKLVPEAVKNTNLKIMLRLTAGDDRDYLGDAMSFNEEQKRFVNTLRAERGGQVQYVAFDENVDQPVLLSMPLRATAASGRLFDEYFPTEGAGK
jgi:hypothetical protein